MTQQNSEGPRAVALHTFIDKKKFGPGVFGLVARDEPTRARLQAIIDALGKRLPPLADQPADKLRVLAEFQRSMTELDTNESEDREQSAGYMEELLDIFSIESSDGLLNCWVYGFDPRAVIRSRAQP